MKIQKLDTGMKYLNYNLVDDEQIKKPDMS